MPTATATSAPASGTRPRLHAANARRNTAAAGPGRLWRWRHARDAAWALLERHIAPGATVAVVGAGNGHDLPLRRLGRHARRLDLVDVDGAALRRTRRRLRLASVAAATITADITTGGADAIIADAVAGRTRPPRSYVGDAGRPVLADRHYDVIVVDLVLSQLLYPALADARLPGPVIDQTLLDHGEALTDQVIASLVAAAAPGGLLICIEDLLGWWAGHGQPFSLDELLADVALHPDNALRRAQQGRLAYGCDGRAALAAAGAHAVDRAWWRWPFAPGTDYLVCATVARVA